MESKKPKKKQAYECFFAPPGGGGNLPANYSKEIFKIANLYTAITLSFRGQGI